MKQYFIKRYAGTTEYWIFSAQGNLERYASFDSVESAVTWLQTNRGGKFTWIKVIGEQDNARKH